MLLAGEAHITDLPRELQGDALAAGFEIVASTGPAMQHTRQSSTASTRCSDDRRLQPGSAVARHPHREAMNRAIDREVLIDVLYDGRADADRPAGHGPAPRRLRARDIADRFEEMYGYDPDRARELLAEAGYPDAFPDPVIPIVTTCFTGNPEYGTLAELMQVYHRGHRLRDRDPDMDWAASRRLGAARTPR
jgi:peptide/nickel transport system substrate-binding protein